MELYVCNSLKDNNISQAVNLHIQNLSYRSFITKFGAKFLEELYKDWIKGDNAILIIAKSNQNIEGFVLGIKNNKLLFNPVKSKMIKYLKLIFFTLLKKPQFIPKILETFFYKRKSQTDINSELLVIVTSTENRSKGLGTELVRKLNEEFKKSGINQYVVTVHAEMEKSNKFYLKNKMSLLDSFMMFNTKWNMYFNKII